ncbi:Gmad2 immunoglobulin-like domain-containing protein [Patescibacteria group bacterium]|nr:Gmad2 immunoglobulin-like domain-containing protein [Patescibacteria group bacterium]
MKKASLLITTLLLAACTPTEQVTIENFDDCAAAGNPIMESYPQQCRTEDGRLFVQDIGDEMNKQDLIRVDMPRPNQPISSPVVIEGEARGYWFFEATFPIALEDDKGNVLALHYATAQGEWPAGRSPHGEGWMTEEFVPFTSEFEADFGEAIKGNLILKKSNPSDLRENDDELRIPVTFEKGSAETSLITLSFYSEEDLSNASFESPVTVTRNIPKTAKVADAALRALFTGPTEEEHEQGARTSDDLQKLGEYYRGITIHSEFQDPSPSSSPITDVAIVNFQPAALEILNSAAARQFMAKTAIEATLMQFPTIDWVFYAIDGDVFVEWDA